MSSHLDDELREILMDLRYTQDQNIQKPLAEKTPNPTNITIEQIKQAFKEAGYIDAKRMVEVAELLRQQAEILKNMADVNELNGLDDIIS